MTNTFADPNQEVESWKDAYYHEFKEVPKIDLAGYLEKEADQILRKYNIRCTTSKLVKKPELVSAG